MARKYRLSAIFFCLAVCGCSNNELLVKKQTEMDSRLEQLLQGNAGTATRIAELSNELKELRNQVKANSADLEVLKPALQESKPVVEAVPQRGESNASSSAASKIVLVNKGGTEDRESLAQDAYMKAFGLFITNDYSGAIEAFESFIATYPTSEYAGNAQYWIGECYYTQREYSRAMEAFTKTVDKYPKGNKVPDAMLKVAYSLISMKQHEKARPALESVVERYPKSPAAMKARERLVRY